MTEEETAKVGNLQLCSCDLFFLEFKDSGEKKREKEKNLLRIVWVGAGHTDEML